MTIPRPLESAPSAPIGARTIWPNHDEVGDASILKQRALSNRRRQGPRQRVEGHHPDLSALGHEFDEELYCCGCGAEYLAVCAFRPVCEGR